jgi:phytoene synthase
LSAGTARAQLALQAEAATKAGSKSFYFASRFFPAPLRRRAYAVYWFCRTTDDLVDEAASLDEGRRDLDAWESELRRGISGGAVENPVLVHFLDTAEECRIPAEYPLDLIAGCRMDLEQARYETFSDLRVFCYRVASTVGLMMCHAIGFADPAGEARGKQHAIDLGIAMQITNILRDVAADRELGRIYLPAEDMARFGYSEGDLAASRCNDAFRALMQHEAARAREHYASAMPGIALLKSEGRFAVEIAAKVYRRILNEIEAMDYNVYARRAVVPAWEKYWITAQAIASAKLDQLRFARAAA